MVSVPKMIGPDFSKTALTTFDLSGSQLIYPLPDNTSPYQLEPAPTIIDLFDDTKNFVGNPEKERFIKLQRSRWEYIQESSLLARGSGNVSIFAESVLPHHGINGKSVLVPNIFAQWIVNHLTHKYTAIYKKHLSHAKFDGGDTSKVKKYCHPESVEKLNISFKNGTVKCHVKSGSKLPDRPTDTLFIPISHSHVLSIYLDFGGFTTGYLGPQEGIDKLKDHYAEEFFSYVRVDYNDEIKAELEKFF